MTIPTGPALTTGLYKVYTDSAERDLDRTMRVLEKVYGAKMDPAVHATLTRAWRYERSYLRSLQAEIQRSSGSARLISRIDAILARTDVLPG